MKKLFFISRFLGLTLISILLVNSCKESEKGSMLSVNPSFREYVQAYTSGIISTRSPIRVRLADNFSDAVSLDMPLEKKYFKLNPGINGKTYWIDDRTLEFRPDTTLPQDQLFTVSFFLSALIQTPDSLKTMVFQFRTMKQEFSVEVENHKAYAHNEPGKEQLTGILRTADLANDDRIESVLKASQNGNDLPVRWTHDSRHRLHQFTVDSIIRDRSSGRVRLEWNGSPIECSSKGLQEINIPALDEFICLGIKSINSSGQCLLVQFSDPLKPDQNLNGLIRIGKQIDMRYVVNDNELRIYLPEMSEDKARLVLESSIRNIYGVELGKKISEEVMISSTAPNLRFVGDGVIMPGSNGMLLPFEAVNLKAIDIKVVRIFEKNILQFLQVNEMNNSNELARVGRVVLKKCIPLSAVTDEGKWNRYSLDLSTLMKPEPGAIYNVILGFKQKYSVYPCSAEASIGSAEDEMMVLENPDKENEKNWGYYSNYMDNDFSDGGWENYKWSEKDDPCKPSYYYDKAISRNVFASDIGMIAKAGSDGNIFVFTTDIVTARPLPDVSIECFNYQLQAIGKTVTDKNGMAVVPVKGKPFILIGVKEKQTAYLKLSDGSALSLSMFDVSGETVQKGVKGFLYGERGVWRPGDSIYLTFILEDKSKQLPPHHPVTFSIYNPNGQMMSRMVKTGGVHGFYNFSTATSNGAPTGNWLAKVNVGGAEFQKLIKIETIKPNRLKINMSFHDSQLNADNIPPFVLEANWLTGSVAKNLKATVNLILTKSTTTFKAFPAYTFSNPTAGFSPENISVFEGRLDENGKVTIHPSIHLTHTAPGVLRANFETMVFEEGGDFSIDRFSIPFYPFKTYAGLSIPGTSRGDRILYTDKTYNIDLVNVFSDGKLVPSNRLKVEVYKLEWRWWWDNSESGEADFISTSHLRPVDSATIRTTGGKASYSFLVGYEDWGRYLIKVSDRSSGHAAARVVYVDWPDYYRMPGGEKQAASMLTFTSDKQRYKVGDQVKLTIPTSPDGRALITLESGSTVLRSFWVPTKQGTTEITFKAEEEMSPNCYAYVTLIQPHAQTKNDLPIRLYGILPILVENPETHLKPQIQIQSALEPGKTANIRITEANGRAMTYTLAIVDEGILDLTRFKTPDPWNAFYAREALGIKTWDMFDQVMGAYSGDLQRILSIGGDQEGDVKGALKANRFKPMVKFFGPFELKKNQSRTQQFLMPDYVGSVRLMVIAGKDGAYGFEEKAAKVKKPLMVLGTLPRVLGPGESVKLPVSVFAMEKNIKNVKIEVETNELIKTEGDHSRSVNFTEPGDQIVTFDLKIKEATGIGQVKIKAECGNNKTEYKMEIDIRNPNQQITDVLEKTIQAGEQWTTAYQPVGIPGTNKAYIELSSMPPLNLENRLGFLITYPYGCIEQTVSAAFPQLFLPGIVQLSEENKGKTDRNIRSAIQKMKSFQLSNGGMGYWPGAIYADDWGSAYTAHFLLEAEKKGYTVMTNTLPALTEYLRQKAISWTYNANFYNDELMQAYRLYVLSLARKPELGAMNRLLEKRDLAISARWCLASAYQLSGKPELALQLASSATMAVKPYRELGFTYGSALRDKAIILDALTLMNLRTKAMPLVKEISAELCGGTWYSTQSTAFALMSMIKFAGGSISHGIHANYRMNTEEPVEVITQKSLMTYPIDPKPGKKGTLMVKNNSKNVLFARLILQGIPAIGETTPASNNLSISLVFKSAKGEKINPQEMQQGVSFMAELTVTNPGILGKYQQLALAQVFPSGWEIINARNSAMAEVAAAGAAFDYQDVRDDRVLTFFDLNPNQSKTFRLMLMATYAGQFYFPPAICEAMYDHTINARIPGYWVKVRPAVK